LKRIIARQALEIEFKSELLKKDLCQSKQEDNRHTIHSTGSYTHAFILSKPYFTKSNITHEDISKQAT
jgi:hypothetical protein